MKAAEKTLVIALTALVYTALYLLNGKLDAFFSVSEHVSWIYMPSGIMLLFVLLFVELGAIGIVLASLWISSQYLSGSDWFVLIGGSLISGLAPLFARKICVDKLLLDMNLNNLTPVTLLKVAVIFSVTSAVLHQLLFTWRGMTTDFVGQTATMAIGNLTGTLIVLYGAKLILHYLVPKPEKAEEL